MGHFRGASSGRDHRRHLSESSIFLADSNSLADLPFKERGPPRHQRTRLCAIVGWSITALLSLLLVLSHSTIAPEIARLDLGKAIDFKSVRKGVSFQPVTIVSGFYLVETGKKHSAQDDHNWLANFLGSVELPVVFFCAPGMVDLVQDLRGKKPITIISDYETPFDMEPIQNLGGRKWASIQHSLDPERALHVPELYGIWTAKPWMVQQAKNLDPYSSRYFFWVDAGGFRDSSIKHTFSGLAKAVDRIYSTIPKDTVILSSIVPFENGLEYVNSVKPTGAMDRTDRIQGGFYGGRGEGIDWWAEETMKVVIMQSVLGRFSAKEQPVWTQAARLNWKRIFVQNMMLRDGDCGPVAWLTFQWFADGKDCAIPYWSGPEYSSSLLLD